MGGLLAASIDGWNSLFLHSHHQAWQVNGPQGLETISIRMQSHLGRGVHLKFNQIIKTLVTVIIIGTTV